jgi:hypothetical protein
MAATSGNEPELAMITIQMISPKKNLHRPDTAAGDQTDELLVVPLLDCILQSLQCTDSLTSETGTYSPI